MNNLVKCALESYERSAGIKLEPDDSIYIWVYVDESGAVESVELNTLNHSPEGVFCEVRDLADIESWWNHDWSYPAE